MLRFLAIGSCFLLAPTPTNAQAKSMLDPKWFDRVATLTPEEQVNAVAGKLVELNKGFNGNVVHKIEDDAVVHLSFKSEYVADLTPLRALTKLRVLHSEPSGAPSRIADLSPLKGLPLQELELADAFKVQDLTPLKDMPLVRLNLQHTNVRSLTPLQNMKTLRQLMMDQDDKLESLKPLAGLPLTYLSIWKCTSLLDLSPLKGMALEYFSAEGCSLVTDIAILRGMPLKVLKLGHTKAANAAILKGMPLDLLSFPRLTDADLLGPLKNTPLSHLHVEDASGVSDLQPLAGKKLKSLSLSSGTFRTLTPLNGMPLTLLHLQSCSKIADIEAVRGMPLAYLLISGTAVSDLSPITNIKLTRIEAQRCKNLKTIAALTGMTSMSVISWTKPR